MWWGFHEGFGWWMWLGWLWMLLTWGLIIGLIVWAVRVLTGANKPGNEPTALEIAERRYARGDIAREEFEEIKAAIR